MMVMQDVLPAEPAKEAPMPAMADPAALFAAMMAAAQGTKLAQAMKNLKQAEQAEKQ